MSKRLKSFVEIAAHSDFPLENLPYGIFSEKHNSQARAGVALGEWEYVPLGPFNAKTFASSISPWIVTLEALEPFKTSFQFKVEFTTSRKYRTF